MHKYSSFVIALAITLLASKGFSQQTIHRCATDEIYQQNIQKYPGYKNRVDAIYNQALQVANNHSAHKTDSLPGPDTTFHIPVVVHIVYNTSAQNIDDSLVYSQIEVLNQDFRHVNADTFKTRNQFKQFEADAKIDFHLATVDPDGNPTTGITRTHTTKTAFSFDLFGTGLGLDAVKYDTSGGVNAWPVDRYMNVWVCNTDDGGLFGLVLGFSYPPDGAPNWPSGSSPADPTMQGVVIHYAVFGRNNPGATGQLAASDLGRTLTHETGHYLGLRHIWGDGTNPFTGGGNNCVPDDGINDTPKADNQSAFDCDTTKNTCDDSAIMGFDYPDLVEDYMDYSSEHCQNMFTFGQVGIMRSMLHTSRASVVTFTVDSIADTTTTTGLVNVVANPPTVKLYPNPASSKVNIVVNNVAQQGQLTVLNLLGMQIGEPVALNPGGNNITLDLGNYAKGVYLVRAVTQGHTITQKLMIE